MAIEAYVGLPGHGKSYGVVEHVVLPSIMEGRHVVTNIPLEREDILADHGIPGSEITQLPEDWFERPDMADFVPAGSVLILDELWRRWPSGLKANQASLADKSLLAEHRHRVDSLGRSMRIVLVTQDLSQLASWVRILVEQTYKMTKLTAIGSAKKYRVDIYLGAPTGQSIPKSKLIRQTYGQYKKQVYKYYSSATQSATGSVGDESKADKRGVIWRSPFIIFSIVGPLIGIPLGLWYVSGIFTGGFGVVDKAKAADHHPAQVQPSGLVNPPPPGFYPEPVLAPASLPEPVETGPVDSQVWRVAGYIRRGSAGTTGATGWPSISGYGHPEAKSLPQAKVPDLVVLHSAIYGTRYVVSDNCDLFPDGINWHCTIDGARVTPWTGRGDATNWASDSNRLVSRTASVASSATERGGSTSQAVNPPPPN
jgi:zona occludens toxin